MSNALRILFTPLQSVTTDRPREFDGATLEFTCFGAGQTLASTSPQPATITLYGVFLDRARMPTRSERKTLATLRGQLQLTTSGAPRFCCDVAQAESEQVWESPTKSEADSTNLADTWANRRVLRIALTPDQFVDATEEPNLIVITVDTRWQRYLEVMAQLEVNGNIEAPIETNGVLDVRITSTNPPGVPYSVSIGVHPPLFDAIPDEASLTLTDTTGSVQRYWFRECTKSDGLLYFRVDSPKPGVLYRAEIRLSDAEPPHVLFQDYELYQLLPDQYDPLSDVQPLGSDGLHFVADDDS